MLSSLDDKIDLLHRQNKTLTVVDCFKHRNKIGHDVALEALKHCWHERRCTMRELREYAEICKVKTVMQPYLEFLAILG